MMLNIYLPDELAEFKADLEYFVNTMLRKLHTNRHKGTGMGVRPDVMVARATEEIAEVWEAMGNEGQFETAVECADVANFMFLAAMSSLNMTREQFRSLKDGNS